MAVAPLPPLPSAPPSLRLPRWVAALTARERLVIEAGFWILAAALFFLAVYLPDQTRLQHLESERLEALSRAAAGARALAARGEIEAETARWEERLRALAQEVPEEADQGRLLVRLEESAAAEGTSLLGVTFGETAEREGFQEHRLSATATGEFGAVVAWLSALEGGAPFLRVSAVRMWQDEKTLTAGPGVAAAGATPGGPVFAEVTLAAFSRSKGGGSAAAAPAGDNAGRAPTDRVRGTASGAPPAVGPQFPVRPAGRPDPFSAPDWYRRWATATPSGAH